MIKNLVFKGGGVLGICYAGAIEVLEQKNILSGIEKVSGTSAGAITALLVSLNYNSVDIKNIINSTNFSSFQDKFNPFRIFTKYGLYKGDAILNWLKNIIKSKGVSENATFLDFKNAGFKDIYIFATSLNTNQLKEFSLNKTPNTVVVEAVRASMSIPLFFQAYQFKNSNPDDDIYVDGGLVYNYPMSIFDTDIINQETLGFFLTDIKADNSKNLVKYNNIFNYLKNGVDSLLNSQYIDFMSDEEDVKRSVIIDSLGISPTNFKLTDNEKIELYNSGINSTIKYLT
jgi:NTE family protein